MAPWKSIESPYLFGIAISNYQDDKPHRLNLYIGDSVIISFESTHWLYGCKKNSDLEGIFPKSYVQITDAEITGNEYAVKRDPIIVEITTVLFEWHEHLKMFYLTRNSNLEVVRKKILELMKFRSQILLCNLLVEEFKCIKLKATWEIDTGNALLGLDMVVRNDNGDVLDISKTSTTRLYEVSLDTTNQIQNASMRNITPLGKNKLLHNVLISVHNFGCEVNEDSEFLFALYDGDGTKPITENFLVKWNQQGFVTYFSKFRVLFTDLSFNDLFRKKVYLVAFVINLNKIGLMDKRDSRAGGRVSHQCGIISSNDMMRRPFGVAALDISLAIKNSEEFKSDIHNLSMPFVTCEKETIDSTLSKLIEKKDLGRNGPSNIGISLEILHGDLKQLKKEYPHLIPENVCFARKMSFQEVIYPGDYRNDLYVTLLNGEFSKRGNKITEKNIEVTVKICDVHGKTVKNVVNMETSRFKWLDLNLSLQITQGGEAPKIDEYHSSIYYHEDRPKWNETFKIILPAEDFGRCHLLFLFKHRSSTEVKDKNEKPFAMSFVQLQQENGTIIQNGTTKLLVYKIDDKKSDTISSYNYHSLPSRPDEMFTPPKPINGLTLLQKDSFSIGINFCSTKLTQNVDLLGLLKWSENTEKLEESLKRFLLVPPEEIVKFLQHALDALFVILVDNGDPTRRYDDLVFQCLLLLLETISDKNYQNFQSVLELYIKETFSSIPAWKRLMTVLESHFTNLFQNFDKEDDHKNMSECFQKSERKLFKTTKNLHYIIKFIVKSRILYTGMYGNCNQFETRLEKLMELFVRTIALPSPLVKQPQSYILKYLHIIASEIMEIYDASKLSTFIVKIITSVIPGNLLQWKMTCIKDLVESELFRHSVCRNILLPIFCEEIRDKLESRQQGVWAQDRKILKVVQLLGEPKDRIHDRESSIKVKVTDCVNIAKKMLEVLHSKDIGSIENDVQNLMLILLRTITRLLIALGRDNPFVVDLVVVLLAILRNMTTKHYYNYVCHLEEERELTLFMKEILSVFKDLSLKAVFPADWLDMIMHQNTIVLESLRYWAQTIRHKFHEPFEKQVWTDFFHCSFEFLMQPSLQLEQFAAKKRLMIISRYLNIRSDIATEISNMWNSLGEHKITFIPQMVGSFLIMSLIPETELRKATIPIFFDMMLCEYESFSNENQIKPNIKGNFRDFEKELIEKLDILVEEGRGDQEFKDLFNEIMTYLCEHSNHQVIIHDGTIFINMATKLMERLLEYRFLINGESKENRMSCTASLLQFDTDENRKEIYIRYVNKLCDLQMEFENYTEAAFTLQLHSKLLLWDDTILSQMLKSSKHCKCQTHRQLKQELYKDIIQLFDKGNMWECALEVCKELVQQYESETFDYMGLAQLYGQMSKFYHNICSVPRHENEYFRVTFYGSGFPELLYNRTFIYRGKEYEQLPSFSARILNQHPRAELMQTLEKPSDEIINSEGQYIQINKVDPIVSDRHQEIQLKSNEKTILTSIVKYYRTNNVDQFKFSRPFRDSSKNWMATSDSDNVGNLWLERTIMKTESTLPGILKWFPVEKSETFKISPIQCANEMMENINNEMLDLLKEHENNPTLAVGQLTMKIQGVVDAAVNGGTTKYEEAFLVDEYLKKNPNDAPYVKKLKTLIADQIPIWKAALNLHRQKVSPDLIPLHNWLEECFANMQKNVELSQNKSCGTI